MIGREEVPAPGFTTSPWTAEGTATLHAAGGDMRSALEAGLRAVLALAAAPSHTPLDTGRSAPIRGEGDDLGETVCRLDSGSAGPDRVLRRQSARDRGRWSPTPRGWWLHRLGICLGDARGGVARRCPAPSRHAHGKRKRHAGHRPSCHFAPPLNARLVQNVRPKTEEACRRIALTGRRLAGTSGS